MIKRNQKAINILNMAIEGMIIFLSYFIAVYIRFILMDGYISLVLWKYPYTLFPCCSAVITVLIYYSFGLYGSFRFKNAARENISIILINTGMLVAHMAVFFVIRIEDFSRGVMILFCVVTSIGIILKRTAVRGLRHYIRKRGYNQRHVIVVGNGHGAFQYINDIKNNPHLGVLIDGYVSKVEKNGLGKCLGAYEDLENILRQIAVDEVIIALEPHEMHFMKGIIASADKEGVRISLISFFNDYFSSYATIEKIGNTKLIDMRAMPLDNFIFVLTKRFVDILGALVRIILLSPVMLIAAVGVKLSSPGPVIFSQDRVGINKRIFKMYKFRSMRVNAEEKTGWSKNADSRKTRFGSIIRKLSIDELPQLFNVLKGDMSLVGPRPEVPYYVDKFREDIPLYLLRQQVKPGITGWAQINGLRGDTSIEDRVKYDIWYIENWSMWLDVKILLRTILGGWINSEKIN